MLGVRKMEEYKNCNCDCKCNCNCVCNCDRLKASKGFFNSIPPPQFEDCGMEEDRFPFSIDDKNEFQQVGDNPDATSCIAWNLRDLITYGISPTLSRTGPGELHLISFLKMVFFFLKIFKRERFFYAIKSQWRRIVRIVFSLSRHNRQEIGFDSSLPDIMQNCGGNFVIHHDFRRWAMRSQSQQFSQNLSLVRLALEVTVRNVMLRACDRAASLSFYEFWMLLRILRHLLGETQVYLCWLKINIDQHGSIERSDSCQSHANDEENMRFAEERTLAINVFQELLEYIDGLVRSHELPDGRHPLIAKLLELM
jgi:hypothetical protein